MSTCVNYAKTRGGSGRAWKFATFPGLSKDFIHTMSDILDALDCSSSSHVGRTLADNLLTIWCTTFDQVSREEWFTDHLGAHRVPAESPTSPPEHPQFVAPPNMILIDPNALSPGVEIIIRREREMPDS